MLLHKHCFQVLYTRLPIISHCAKMYRILLHLSHPSVSHCLILYGTIPYFILRCHILKYPIPWTIHHTGVCVSLQWSRRQQFKDCCVTWPQSDSTSASTQTCLRLEMASLSYPCKCDRSTAESYISSNSTSIILNVEGNVAFAFAITLQDQKVAKLMNAIWFWNQWRYHIVADICS